MAIALAKQRAPNEMNMMMIIIILRALVFLSLFLPAARCSRPWSPYYTPSKAVAQSLVDLEYHMGPVLTSDISVYLVWYGRWSELEKRILREFFLSVSAPPEPAGEVSKPSVRQWWSTARLYSDQTGANISGSVRIVAEHDDLYSQGKTLTRMSVQEVIRAALKLPPGSNPNGRPLTGTLPIDPRNGAYFVLSAADVAQQDFCRAVCGFHYFTYPSIVGYTLPYSWVGNSGSQCPETCAYPFAVPAYMAGAAHALQSPNGNIGVDGMVSVVAHELAEMASNPLINAWYAGSDPTAPVEIADLCEGTYGTGGGGGFIGLVSKGHDGASYNMYGVAGRRYLIQWIWNPTNSSCRGP